MDIPLGGDRTSKRIASRRQRKRERYLAETGDATDFDDEDSESLTSDEDAAPEERSHKQYKLVFGGKAF